MSDGEGVGVDTVVDVEQVELERQGAGSASYHNMVWDEGLHSADPPMTCITWCDKACLTIDGMRRSTGSETPP
jgi:hypothetical protein